MTISLNWIGVIMGVLLTGDDDGMSVILELLLMGVFGSGINLAMLDAEWRL